MNPTENEANAASVPVTGSKDGKKTSLKTRAAAVPKMKKSYHSIVVPMRLATGAAGDRVCGLLQVGSLLEGVVDLVTVLEGPRALRGALPALIGHELVFSRAHLGVFRCGEIVGNGDASAGIVDQLVTLLDFLLVPFVGHAGERASVIGRRAGIRRSMTKNE